MAFAHTLYPIIRFLAVQLREDFRKLKTNFSLGGKISPITHVLLYSSCMPLLQRIIF